MEYLQKKGANVIKMDLKEDRILCDVKDETSDGVFSIRYEDITNDRTGLMEAKTHFKSYSIYLLIIAILFIVSNIIFGTHHLGGLFFVASLFTYLIYRFSVVRYTIIEAGERKIYVIRDKEHDEIVEQIYAKRDLYLKTTYGKLNTENDPNDEIEKFIWLKELGVINQDEFDSIHAELLTKTIERNEI